MILHVAEIWAALAVCFILGALVGSIVHRVIALTRAGRAQASLIRAIDRLIRALERVLLPWRGTVPAMLPRTVPVPPPDFSHVVDEPALHAAVETYVPRHMAGDPILDVELPGYQPPPAVRASKPASGRMNEAVARGDLAGVRPLPLQGARQGGADPLHLINGVTKRHAGRLAQVGIYHFSQIAAWTPQEVAWTSAYLGIGDAIIEKDWVGQAMQFASADEPVRLPDPTPKAAGAAKPKSSRKRGPRKAGGDNVAGDAAAGQGAHGEGETSKPAKAAPRSSRRKTAAKPKASAAVEPVEAVAEVDAIAGGDVLAADVSPADARASELEAAVGAAASGSDSLPNGVTADHRREP